MNIKTMLRNIFKVFLNSKKRIHVFSIGLSFLIIILLKLLRINMIDKTLQLNVLTGVSLLASFFLLTLQNIDYKYLNSHFDNEIKITKTKMNKESVVVRNTIFSLSIVCFSITGIGFILYLFHSNLTYILVLLIVYLFVGIIYTMILWNYFSSKK